MKVWLIIPAYNEAQGLDKLLDQLKAKNLPVLVVDDGSQDATYEVAKKKATLAISHSKNLGKGLSLNKGISHLLANEQFDYIIVMDADGQHAPEDLGRFLKQAEAGADFVVGNRMEDPRGMPLIRVITNKLMSWFISKLTGQYIPDTQCGFRMIKREVLEKIDIKTKKFEIESEILIKAARLKFIINSIPIRSIYFDNPQSKISPLRDTLRFVKFISKIEK
ncbi:MAG: glycosyltransferase family 2 protein [Candidatus Omnitrophica bacterium]|nr:glycosyltransferase family 2 protein [Candidatus Omnitrophota bacterium]MBU2044850.1 glycosyltransferase family 2 protein [Candidatus Omnitrophota bacterium]MBU2251498.1 glycosyltransferase family 2 protein [Candidatus Omnitrophota bacterium]MBU2473635.1 glycosyltransferase family 2 protein [Candidatus Omnitrophota bacterium]